MASTPPSQHYSIRWNNYHSNLLTVFDELLLSEAFADVTLYLDNGQYFKCHKVVLAACSTYFQSIFQKQGRAEHVIVALKDVDYFEIKTILEYMYRGEMHVAHEQLGSLLKLAKSFKIKGLLDINETSNLPFHRDFNNTRETTVSPPYCSPSSQAAPNSITSSIPSNIKISPPHSTELDGNAPYGNMPPEEDRHLYYQYHLPFLALSSQHSILQTKHPNLGPSSSSQATAMNASEDLAYDEPQFKRRKRLLPKYSTIQDTPILRTVLNQKHIDTPSVVPPSMSSDNNEARTDSIMSLSERGVRENTNLVNYETLEPSSYVDMIDEENKTPHPPTSSDMHIINNYADQQKPEWKRYKQYTREDIRNAIEAVKTGMSALQASRLHGVPSRTLYDKVKKLGISSNRPSKRGATRSGMSASFPTNFGDSSNNYGPNSSGFVPECEDEASMNSNNQHENNPLTGTTPQPTDTNFVSDMKVKDELIKLNMENTEQTSPNETIVIKEEKDEQYSNFENEIQDLSMHSKNIPTSNNINDSDPDNLDHS